MPKIIAAFSLALLSLLPAASIADIYAQSGYENGQDGILLLTTECHEMPGFKVAFIRVDHAVLEGCYVENNRGNYIVKWSDGSIGELPGNLFNVKAEKKVKAHSVSPGYYIQLSSGWKQGGPSRHGELARILKRAPELKPYQIFCITGPDLTQATTVEVEAYNQKHPILQLAPQCKGSSFLLVGPFPSEQEMRDFLSVNVMESYDMHLYKHLDFCEAACKEIPE